MEIEVSDADLKKTRDKVLAQQRLNFEDGVALYSSNDIIGIGLLADRVRRQMHGKRAFYVVNQHLNYTNVCVNRCAFCAFARDEGQNGAFTLTPEQIRGKLSAGTARPVREVHMVGGLNPALPLEYYLDLVRAVRQMRPLATVKAFTAVEIDYISRISGLSLSETIETLRAEGLEMLPGGGAEIMSGRVREKLFPKKIGRERWLQVMKEAHRAGLTSNATMLYGHIETVEERVRHLLELRELQDETGGFCSFIPLAFHPANTKLSRLPETTGFEDLKNIAIARLMLDNFDHIKAYWVMIGEKLAQVALSFGADDLDGTIVEEQITHMAGAKSAKGLTPDRMDRMILAAGFEPVERDSFYRPIHQEGLRYAHA